eukprot:COSAG06_NODE_27103_length_601_cov_0.719124_1_plen_117_part_10
MSLGTATTERGTFAVSTQTAVSSCSVLLSWCSSAAASAASAAASWSTLSTVVQDDSDALLSPEIRKLVVIGDFARSASRGRILVGGGGSVSISIDPWLPAGSRASDASQVLLVHPGS